MRIGFGGEGEKEAGAALRAAYQGAFEFRSPRRDLPVSSRLQRTTRTIRVGSRGLVENYAMVIKERSTAVRIMMPIEVAGMVAARLLL
ncbi:hypothetical protein DXG01_011232 [Tephrocybe rancida]|nr:hypothetical protein DXG01_011232 [Tephrocybe rancida]